MAKNKITASFRLFSLFSVLISTLLSKALRIAYMYSAADITVSNVLTYIFQYGFEITNLFALAFTVCSTVYAFSYFGKKTAIQTSLISFACLFMGKAVVFTYNVLVNELSTTQLLSGALTYAVEILFDMLIIIIALSISYSFARFRAKCQREDADNLYSPTKAACLCAGIYFFLLIADLSFTNVIPFFVQYSDPTASEIRSIITDYLYYLLCLPVTVIIIILVMFVFTKVTGKLMLKKYFQKQSKGTEI